MSDYDPLDQAKKRERNRLWSLLTELGQEPPDIEQCTADGLHKRLRVYLADLIAERNRLFHEVRCLRGEMVEREMQHETEIAGLRAQNERGPVWPDATQPHDFVGESSDCLCCGEGRLHYLHKDKVDGLRAQRDRLQICGEPHPFRDLQCTELKGHGQDEGHSAWEGGTRRGW